MLNFHIGEPLLIERAIVVALTIIVFGLFSIGGLYLLRHRTRRSPPGRTQGEAEEVDRLFQALDEIEHADTNVRAAFALRLITGRDERAAR